MLAALCRALFVSVLLGASTASAQPVWWDPTEPGAIPPAITTVTYEPPESPPTVDLAPDVPRWRPRRRALIGGAVAALLGYVGGLAVGTFDAVRAHGSSCDETVAGVHAVPLLGPILAWIVLGTCRFQGYDNVLHGFVEIPLALAQLAGVALLVAGHVGRTDRRRSRLRVDVSPSGLGLEIAF